MKRSALVVFAFVLIGTACSSNDSVPEERDQPSNDGYTVNIPAEGSVVTQFSVHVADGLDKAEISMWLDTIEEASRLLTYGTKADLVDIERQTYWSRIHETLDLDQDEEFEFRLESKNERQPEARGSVSFFSIINPEVSIYLDSELEGYNPSDAERLYLVMNLLGMKYEMQMEPASSLGFMAFVENGPQCTTRPDDDYGPYYYADGFALYHLWPNYLEEACPLYYEYMDRILDGIYFDPDVEYGERPSQPLTMPDSIREKLPQAHE